jgi:hypothetical protein
LRRFPLIFNKAFAKGSYAAIAASTDTQSFFACLCAAASKPDAGPDNALH